MAPRFHGLLVVPDAAEAIVNLAPGHDPLDTYVLCAATCHASFAAAGYRWELVTDDTARIEARRAALGLAPVPMRELAFAREVPAGLAFRSAHHKLELLARFGSGEFGEHVGLVDLDAVCLGRLPAGADGARGLVGYDMSELVARSALAGPTVASLSQLAGTPQALSWWGGEFLVGQANAFAALAEPLERLWPRYLEGVGHMAHVGDEMVLTAALQAYRDAGGTLIDGGAAGAIARYWSARTVQRMPRFRTVAGSAVLHLPTDKPLLARWARRAFDAAAFRRSYAAHLRRKIAVRRIAALVRPNGRHPPRF